MTTRVPQFVHCQFLSLLHLGFFQGSSRYWAKRNSFYVTSLRRGFPLFDAVLGNFLLRRALAFLASISLHRGLILVLADVVPPTLFPRRHRFLRFLLPGSLSNYRVSRVSSRLSSLPSALLLVDGRSPSYYALREAALLGIPTVAFLPPNFEPSSITYPIPLSSRSPQALSFFLRLAIRALRRRPVMEFSTFRPYLRRRS